MKLSIRIKFYEIIPIHSPLEARVYRNNQTRTVHPENYPMQQLHGKNYHYYRFENKPFYLLSLMSTAQFLAMIKM
jgi:hypothetical protein